MKDRDMEIFKIEVRTKKSKDVLNLAEDLRIDEYNLNEAFCNQPSLYAYWATVASQARALADRAKLEVDKHEDYMRKTLVGILDVEVRRELEMNGEKVTESKVTNEIYCHEDYLAAQTQLYELKEKYLDANETAVTLEIARDAMNQRKDALISLGAQMRNDASNLELTIKKQQAKEVISKSKQSKA